MHRTIKSLLIAGLGAGGLFVAGCEQQRQFEVEAQQPAPTVQTQAPAATAAPTQPQERAPDVPYVPTPQEVVDQMLQLANVTSNDVVYDLGSGDGRIPITAVQKFGASRAYGFEINPELVQRARQNADTANVSDRVQIVQQDLFQTDLREATVVTLYLLPDINIKLRPKLLRELRPGTRIVSHDFDMGEWQPDNVVRVQGPSRQHTLYLWTVPENVPANLQ
ncbi:methyltransferase domain-containing protein [Chroogloeocystis siderophila]|jgi:protein-L-isoaspartate O-methyltransferase|uniref:SAM-dependent methyltransferase n=1 Tax=Chroogloeocystis siderophila 5.2 s.c.1 TaxID=247279 RepID=A0A1U7HM50_9CHRO|nr:class I SAM-dependent methyltransferase [Chroogloeocystis siderophila]OKH24634.1 SAM-dependent methyltransferase [Chroogloeocystis siderophila 5.2 s.c.1]